MSRLANNFFFGSTGHSTVLEAVKLSKSKRSFIAGYLTLGLAVALINLSAFATGAVAEASPHYNRDIRPILSENCFACHGPDKNQRKGKLRLDVRDAALEKQAIIPGTADESELVKRIYT